MPWDQAREGERAGAVETPHDLPGGPRRHMHNVRLGVIHVRKFHHQLGVSLQRARCAEHQLVKHLPFVLGRHAQGLALGNFEPVGDEAHRIRHANFDRASHGLGIARDAPDLLLPRIAGGHRVLRVKTALMRARGHAHDERCTVQQRDPTARGTVRRRHWPHNPRRRRVRRSDPGRCGAARHCQNNHGRAPE